MADVDSDALLLVRSVLGQSGTAAPGTVLDDGRLDQVLDVNEIVRRSRTLAGTTGMFHGILEATHAAAGDLTTTIDPYNPLAPIAPWPAPVPDGFDVWLIGGCTVRTGGTAANWVGGALSIATPAVHTAFSQDQAGAASANAANEQDYTFGIWDSLDLTLSSDIGITADGEPYIDARMRLRRGSRIRFRSTAVNGAVTMICVVVVGLFPASLGQDIAT